MQSDKLSNSESPGRGEVERIIDESEAMMDTNQAPVSPKIIG
jgi:hypothetical protein